MQTINNIEKAQSTQLEINKLWSEIKSLFSQELDKLPSVPISQNKKQNKLIRKSQPFWNTDLEELWKATCEVEKSFVSFKVKSHADHNIKSQLRLDFKNAQKHFDKTFRQAERNFKNKKILILKKMPNLTQLTCGPV